MSEVKVYDLTYDHMGLITIKQFVMKRDHDQALASKDEELEKLKAEKLELRDAFISSEKDLESLREKLKVAIGFVFFQSCFCQTHIAKKEHPNLVCQRCKTLKQLEQKESE
jgi:hypothetical protein